ncbi:MAG: biotin--[acetyl-CoA-carboxylase] ligase [Candidatus Eisenbacteria bacterium]|nr:biotin--[acetyl-CoA-carboxylase] ligase [Candidatus Eisenbacteria bacterium]
MTIPPPRPVERHESIGSTNDRAADLARAGAPHGTVVVAGEQLQGRGRHGRAWRSARGQGLWASVLVRTARPVAEQSQLALVTGLAVCDALALDLGAPDVTLRWPNDVDLRGRKVAGILCERVAGGTGAVVAGIGINTGAGAVPPELAATATSLEPEGLAVTPERLLDLLRARLDTRVDAWERGGFGAVRDEYLARLDLLGREAGLAGAGEGGAEVRGTVRTVDAAGALVLATAAGERAFHAGQVTRVR